MTLSKKTVLSFGDDDDNNNKDNRDNTLKAIDYFLTIINEIIRDEGSRKLTFDEAVKEFRQDFREEFPADADKFDNFIRRFIKSD